MRPYTGKGQKRQKERFVGGNYPDFMTDGIEAFPLSKNKIRRLKEDAKNANRSYKKTERQQGRAQILNDLMKGETHE